METFQSDIDDVKEDVQELKNDIQTIQKMLQQIITPAATVKTTFSTEPSGLMASNGGTHRPAGRYYIHHDTALVPIPSARALDLMRMNWTGGGYTFWEPYGQKSRWCLPTIISQCRYIPSFGIGSQEWDRLGHL
jgi:hypothetical protein